MFSHKNTIKNASDFVNISEGKWQRIYNHYIEVLIKAREPESSGFLSIDDIARRRGHNCNTVIYNKGLITKYNILELKAFCKTLDNW